MNESWPERISVDPAVCHGKPCIRGARILVSVILENLAAGLSNEEIIESNPGLTVENIRAVLNFAAELARERTVYVGRSG
jgi:uncharacterized protein (DUF433 family)